MKRMKKQTLLVLAVVVTMSLGMSQKASAQAACAPPWQIGIAITTGEVLSFNGHNWKAIQPEVQTVDGWQPPNTPALWSDQGPCTGGGGGGATCSATPAAPSGLTAPTASITQNSVTLNWTAVTAPANCTVSGYTVFENGTQVGTTTNTTFNVTGLAAGTAFTFAVAASDEAGQGASSSVSATTPSAGGGGGGGNCAAAWNSATAYHGGDNVSFKGINYHANFFSQNQEPDLNNGGPGSGQPWTSQGACSTCSVAPSTPTGLTASGTTGCSTNLAWTAATAPSNCTITYSVAKNGSVIGNNISATSFNAFGLTPSTMSAFTVTASDSAGSSAASSALNVTTSSTACAGGNVIFGAYKDVTNNADFNTGLQRSSVTGTVQPVTSAMPNKTLIWAFATGTCDSESWAGITPAMEATNVQAFVNAGKNYIISTGGANGAFDCPSGGQGLINFINRYNSPNLVGVDFDIELGQSQQLIDNLINATKGAMGQFPNLQFSFTIQSLGTLQANPITGGSVGGTVVNEIKRLGLTGKFVVNLMTFDYGSSNPNNCVVANNLCDMGQSAIQAAQALNQQSGIPLNHIGVTMMIGQADTQDEITSLKDIDTISAFVKSNNMPSIAFWAFDRDQPGSGGSSSSGTPSVPALAYTREFMSALGVQ